MLTVQPARCRESLPETSPIYYLVKAALSFHYRVQFIFYSNFNLCCTWRFFSLSICLHMYAQFLFTSKKLHVCTPQKKNIKNYILENIAFLHQCTLHVFFIVYLFSRYIYRKHYNIIVDYGKKRMDRFAVVLRHVEAKRGSVESLVPAILVLQGHQRRHKRSGRPPSVAGAPGEICQY